MSGTKALRSIGISRARTAYGFLRDVQRTILADHQSADMTTVCMWASDVDEDDMLRPACGVVGCFAGWVNLKSLGRELTLQQSGVQNARNFLGSTLNYSFGGPDGDSYYVFNAGSGDRCETTKPGTKAHARAVARRIDGFIKRNEAALRARKLVKNEDGTLSPAPGQD